jgi:hypothetical protein
MVDEMCGRLRHVPAVAGGAHAPPLARKCYDELLRAPRADRAGEPEAEQPAREIVAKLLFDVCRDGLLAGRAIREPALEALRNDQEQGLGVSAYKRAEDGRLTLWRRSRAVPADVPADGVSSSSIVITPDGRHVYAGIRGPDEATNAIACYAVADDGSLAPRGLVPADKVPWGMALSPDGRFLAATGYNTATLVLYRRAADGSLTRVATLPWDGQIPDVIAR